MSIPDRGWIILAVSWPLFGICAILILLRIWVRTRILRSWGWDDAFIIIAMLCATTNTALSTISAHHGTGRHAVDLSQYQTIQSTKFNWLSQGFHVMSTNWGKVSVGFFLLRIIGKVKHHRPVMYGGIVLLTVINSVCVYTIYGQCSPTSKLWDTSVKGRCWDPDVQKNYAFFQGSSSALSDLVLAVYPLFTIWNLQMVLKVKIGLGVVLSLGVIAMIAAIVKTVNLASLSARADYPWDTVDLTIWIAIEQYLIIIAACIPTLTPLFNIAVRQRTSKKHTSSNNKIGAFTRSRQSGWFHPHPHPLFASGEGKEDVYPLAWARSERVTGSESGDPIVGIGLAEPNQGILMTTEIRVQSASEFGDSSETGTGQGYTGVHAESSR
ncbi:hypothetical protein BJX63DRAFT_436757 [Aspergillus granulosus]|uniref:Rhodopsin domain-containing protein n=1 Tax=Aspergillus granulosus TaxID=176169 RepID=A0ABR4GX45_9EURO